MKQNGIIRWIPIIVLTLIVTVPAALAATGLKLDFTGVEDLGENHVYEGWIMVDGAPVSTGTFSVSPGGALHPSIFPVTEYQAANATAFILSIEPRYDHDPAPSDVKYLAGEFSGDMADLSLDHPAVLGTDFSMASGAYILETPSTAGTPGDYDQGIWFLDPAGSPDPSLDLPDLPAGWVYEGWIVTMDGPMTTGRFTMTDMADSDGGGPYAGPDGTPPFPGQDYIDPPMSLIGTTVVISVEPEPDNSPNPFAIKPLVDMTVEDVGAGMLQDLEYVSDNLPTGTAQFIDVVSLELDFVNLQDLGDDYVYEGWIVGHGPTSTGIFMVDEMGNHSMNMTYVDKHVADNAGKFVLSIEPYPDPDPAPSDTKLLAGSFADNGALLTIRDSAALGTDFFTATGGYILETPSTAGTGSDWNQGIWFLDPGAGPGPSLNLPALPDGWVYEGWVAGMDGPVTTGRFTMADMADDDAGGPYAGPDSTPPFPGQDYIDPAMVLTDGFAAVISVEPEPDNSPDPFVLKPLMDPAIDDLGAGMFQTMDNIVYSNMPYGTALLGFPDTPDTGFELMLDDPSISSGELFHLHYYLHNGENASFDADVWIILDVYGELFLYPSWININDGVDFEENVTVAPMTSRHRVALLFVWPDGLGFADGLYFHGAATTAGTFDFIGDINSVMWGYL